MDNRSFAINPPTDKKWEGLSLKGQLIQRRFACSKKWSQSAEWVVTMFRNRWTVCSGMGGHNAAEWLDSFQRNEWSLCGGIRNNGYLESGLPRIKRSKIPKFKNFSTIKYSTKNIGQFISINYDRKRVATVGRTFLDMIRKAELCGGMHKVVSIYKRYAKKHLGAILPEIENYGLKIDKVRAGYILDEVCGIKNDIVISWQENAQRGGSQRLDPGRPYAPVFSEKWCLSINV
jgi:hypothetical protein